ncbi:MAG: hypothetical protein H5U40_03310 [Polyangiaceae bacterium]|nr:hypothetical protein [Polyangiaceae bacterium]
MKQSPASRTNERRSFPAADALFLQASGRSVIRLSKRRAILGVAAFATTLLTAGFSLGFLLHG